MRLRVLFIFSAYDARIR
jgi:hypothetical protein